MAVTTLRKKPATRLRVAPGHAADAAPATEPPAAALAHTSNDPIVLQSRALLKSGRFRAAEALLASRTKGSRDLRVRIELAEIIRRMRHNYSLSAADLLDKVRTSIPDATAAEVARWARESRARWRRIDGRKFFFRREPRNIFLLSAEARERLQQAGAAPADSNWNLVDHLKAIVKEAERTGNAEVFPVHHEITHLLTIPGHTPGVRAGSFVRVWLPFPQAYRQQAKVKLLSASPKPKLIAPAAGEGNSVTGTPQRSVYFEHRVIDPAKSIEFKLAYEYTSHAYYPELDEDKAQPLPPDWNDGCLNERPPHIVFTPAMRRQVASILGRETNPLAKARKLFRWVSANLQWNAEDEYCLIPSFARRGFTKRRGDCGVLNTVFITLCRLAGIPARWQSGFATLPSNPGGGGMHDWSEIYIAPWGWLPADASTGTYAAQKSDDPRIADFYCGHLDSYRTIVNLDWGRDLVPPKQSLRSEPADFQRGEVEVDGRNLYFDQWDYDMKFKVAPVGR